MRCRGRDGWVMIRKEEMGVVKKSEKGGGWEREGGEEVIISSRERRERLGVLVRLVSGVIDATKGLIDEELKTGRCQLKIS